MADFTITITDAKQLAGIAWAREQYNAGLPTDARGNPIGALATDAEYLQWLVERTTRSYVHERAEMIMREADADATVTRAIAAADAGDLVPLDDLRARYAERTRS